MCYQRHNFEKLMALCPMLEQGGERRVEDSSAGDILVGEEPLDEEMVGLEAAIPCAGGPLCIDDDDSIFGSDL